MESIPRRSILKKAVAAALGLTVGSLDVRAQSDADAIKLLASPLTKELLERQKNNAIETLSKNIPSDPSINHIRDHVQNLRSESQMYIPSEEEMNSVVEKSRSQIQELLQHVERNKYGIFVFADVNQQRIPIQRLYVIQRNGNNRAVFIKGYRVSMARNGFGNTDGSEMTPLGLHTIASSQRGILGEIVSSVNPDQNTAIRVSISGHDHWFVKSFGNNPTVNHARVVTDQYLLVGPNTRASRGIRIHGTNIPGELVASGDWRTSLDGQYRSNGCIRMSNTDIRDLYTSGYLLIHPQSSQNGSEVRVMIHATPEAVQFANVPTHNEIKLRPPRLEKTEEKKVPPQTTKPERWERPDQK